MPENPVTQKTSLPVKSQLQTPPGRTAEISPRPDHGEHSYKGSGRLQDKVALITGRD
jgi:hypothetical protein